MPCQIRFKTSNAAFADNPAGEPTRILHHIAQRIKQCETDGVIADINGNAIGSWHYTTDAEPEEETTP